MTERPAHSRVRLTYDDFVHFPDDGQRHELIDGEHVVTPSPNIRHQQILFNLTLLLGSWLEHHPIGRVYFAPLDVVFSHFDVVEPDLLYMSNERMAAIVTKQHVRGAPSWWSKSGPVTRQRDDGQATVGDRFSAGYGIVDPELTWSACIGVTAISLAGQQRPREAGTSSFNSSPDGRFRSNESSGNESLPLLVSGGLRAVTGSPPSARARDGVQPRARQRQRHGCRDGANTATPRRRRPTIRVTGSRRPDTRTSCPPSPTIEARACTPPMWHATAVPTPVARTDVG